MITATTTSDMIESWKHRVREEALPLALDVLLVALVLGAVAVLQRRAHLRLRLLGGGRADQAFTPAAVRLGPRRGRRPTSTTAAR